MSQKIIITNETSTINQYLEDGWEVINVTAQHVASSGKGYSDVLGKFCFVLEK